jgi:hypothetical protein
MYTIADKLLVCKTVKNTSGKLRAYAYSKVKRTFLVVF